MATETKPETPVPDSVYADYEQDLVNEGVPPGQARASRRALERIIDRLTIVMATKGDLQQLRLELRGEIADLRGEFANLRSEFANLRKDFAGLRKEFADQGIDLAVLRAEMRMLKWMFAIIGPATIGLIAAVLVVLLTRS